jgi:hypothetical protein
MILHSVKLREPKGNSQYRELDRKCGGSGYICGITLEVTYYTGVTKNKETEKFGERVVLAQISIDQGSLARYNHGFKLG